MKLQKILVIVIIALLGLTTTVLSMDASTPTPEPKKEEVTTPTPEPKSTPDSSEEMKPTPTPTPEPQEIEWTDFSKVKLTLVRDEKEKVYYNYNLKIENFTFDTHQGTEYHVFMANSSTKPNFGKTKEELEQNAVITLHSSNPQNEIPFSFTEEFVEKAGDIYVWVVETRWNENTLEWENNEVLSAKKVTKPSLGKVGTRMKAFFHAESTSVFVYVPNKDTNRKVKLKIGKINDRNILLSIKNGEANCLEKLLDYAKQANSVYTGNVPIDKSTTITDKFNIVNEEYFYVYMQLDDENGKYGKVEEVSLYQGLVGEQIGKNLYDYLSQEFKWNLDEEQTPTTPTPTPDNTTAKTPIPQTGEVFTIIAILAGVVIVGIGCYIGYRKYKGI